MNTSRILAVTLVATLLGSASVSAEDGHSTPNPPREKWSFAGIFGKFDEAQLQRGFQVYREVCSNCHSMSLVKFRNLAEKGGPGFTAGQVKALAAEYKIKDGPNDAGDMFERPRPPMAARPRPISRSWPRLAPTSAGSRISSSMRCPSSAIRNRAWITSMRS
jgi:ubiquinol-cytochrome c reductase cytochrome c1 subunit